MYVHHPHCMNGSRTVVQVYLRCGAGPARRVAPLRPPPLGPHRPLKTVHRTKRTQVGSAFVGFQLCMLLLRCCPLHVP